MQEVSRFLTQSPGDFLAGNPVQAQDVALDFLDKLLSALSELGQNYTVAAYVDNSDVEFISITADDIRQVDREVILARSDVTVTASQTGHYVHRGSVPLPGGNSIDIPRGWTLVDLIVDGGYTDNWMDLTDEPSATCCQSDDLVNRSSTLSGRIDMIFHRGDLTPLSASVVGNQIEDRTASGLWPSDHAGVVATLSLP